MQSVELLRQGLKEYGVEKRTVVESKNMGCVLISTPSARYGWLMCDLKQIRHAAKIAGYRTRKVREGLRCILPGYLWPVDPSIRKKYSTKEQQRRDERNLKVVRCTVPENRVDEIKSIAKKMRGVTS